MAKAMAPASAIADLICSKLGDNTGAKKAMMLQFIALGFQKVNLLLNIDKSIQTQIFEVCGDNQFEMCDAFVYETKVGIRRKATDTKPQGKLCTLNLNTDMERSTCIMNDTDTLNTIGNCIDECQPDDGAYCDCYFYNGPCGLIPAYGRGFANNGYYNIKDGVLNISPYLHKLGDDIELVVEYVCDVLNVGLTLVPSELFMCLYYFGMARYYDEGENGKFQGMFESEFATFNRLYNFRSIDQLVELYKG